MLAISGLDANSNGEIDCSEAAAYTGAISVSYHNISDLTGIETFTGITSLDCSHNQLTDLNVSANTALNSLTCNTNHLTTINVTSNSTLTYLSCGFNQLTNLDVSANTAFTYLECAGNLLTTLDVSANTALNALICYSNQLASLNVSTNTRLTALSCGNNLLATLDVSTNTGLTELDCYNNSLISLNIKNGYNSNLAYFYAYQNPNLNCIQVDNVAWSTANWTVANGNIDAAAHFSTNCNCTLPNQPGPITGLTSICANSTNTYSIASVTGATSYTWTIPGTWSGTSTSNSINVTSDANGGTISVTANNACGSSAPQTQSITVNLLPVATFGYTSSPYCTNGSNPSPSFNGGGIAGTFTAAPSGLSINGNTGTVNLSASSALTYTVTNTISASGGCSSVNSTATITINSLPAVGITASATTVCSGTSVTLSGTGATSYTWSGGITNGAAFTPISNATYTVTGTSGACSNTATQPIIVTPTPICQNGGTVNASCGCNCPSGFTGALCQTIIGCTAAPAPPTIAGPTGYCGITHPVFSATSNEATTYTWSVPVGVTAFTGQGTSSITTTMSSTSTGSGILTLTVTATNACGTSTSSTFNTAKKPLAPSSITGPVSVCGLSTAAYSASVSAGATSYTWSLPAGITMASGTGTASIHVNIAPSFSSGNITVYAINACGNVGGTVLSVYGKVPGAPVHLQVRHHYAE